MRMSVGPRHFRDQVTSGWRHFADLEPPEDDVKLRRVPHEANNAPDFLGAAKTSEEKKQIAAAYLLIREMTLRGRGLAEDRTPSRGALERIAAQIRIEMRAVASTDATAGQVFDNFSD